MQGYGEILWQPTSASIKSSNLTSFIDFVNQKLQLNLQSWEAVHGWSVEYFQDFWLSLAEFFKIELKSQPYSNGIWFQGTQLNYAEEVLKGLNRHGGNRADHDEALISFDETETRQSMSWKKLRTRVETLAHFLESRHVQPGDRVAGIVTNQMEAVIGALATSYVGAVWTSCSPDFGLSALEDRLGQTTPKVLIAVTEYSYKGRLISIEDKLEELVLKLPSLGSLIVCGQVHNDAFFLNPSLEIISLDQVLSVPTSCTPKPVAFSAPLYILYSSGTTGKPKCIIHSVGGTLLQHMKELALHTDIKPGEKLLYFTTCGWMMWNWMLSGLAVGATLVLFDGNPMYPNSDSLIGFIGKEQIHHFGASAKYYAALKNAGFKSDGYDFSSLKTLLSTGSPLLPETFDYLYSSVKKDVRVASISGGTDIVSCFALGNPWLPVRRGELQSAGLGMAVDVFNDEAQAVINQTGELVCTQPFPAQPIGFWADESGEKYRQAYFSRFKDIWCQGDYAIKTEQGGLVILGRSDAVLNPGGVRIGTAEIYRQVETLDEIADCLAAGFKLKDDEAIWLFVVLQSGYELTQELVAKIKQQIKSNTSPRHVPAVIFAVTDLPRTRSGKIAELAVKKVINGETVENLSSLANPESLEQFKSLQV